ncbi:hypothetical protein REPUB_Repub03eG0096500 [Reevesia pubescens]
MNGKQKNEVKNIEIPVDIVDEGIGEVLGEGESENESDRINECEVVEDNTHKVSLDGMMQEYENDYMDSDDPDEYESELSDDEVQNHMRKTYIGARYKPRCVVPWRLFTSHDSRNNSFVIRTYHPERRCFRSNKSKLISTEYISEHFRGMILSQSNLKIRELKELSRTELNVYVSENMCQRAKRIVIK